MAITSLAQVRSGLQPPVYWNKAFGSNGNGSTNNKVSSWGQAGYPGAGAFDTTLNGVALVGPVTGGITPNTPPSGNCYLARLQAAGHSSVGVGELDLTLCDRLWHNGGLDQTGAASPQSITSPTWPARDVAGSTNGDGVLLGIEFSTAMAGIAGNPVVTVGYTNSAGTSGRTATSVDLLPSSAAAAAYATFFSPIGLQAGDTGVQSVQSFSITASIYSTGTMNLVAYRPIACLCVPYAGYTGAIDAVTAALPIIYNNSVLYLVERMGGSGNQMAPITGNLQYAFG